MVKQPFPRRKAKSMFEAMKELPFSVAEFLAVCDTLKDLPFQNGEDDWKTLASMLELIKREEIALQVFVVGQISAELSQSPLIELLRGNLKDIKPPTKFRSAKSPHLATLKFTADDFLGVCIDACDSANHLWQVNPLHTPSWTQFLDMIEVLDSRRVNLLEFLSSEETDDLLDNCSLFRLVLHTTAVDNKHIIVDRHAFHEAVHNPIGWLATRHVPPYPPSRFGLDFDQAHLLKWMQAAEEDMSTFEFDTWNAHRSYAILHSRVHQLDGEGLQVATFMAGHEPVEGSPGSTIFSYFNEPVWEPGYFDCNMFFANVASGGQGEAFLSGYWDDEDELQDGLCSNQPRLLNTEQAEAFVSALPKVDVATIARDSMRCPHCWSDWDEVEEGIDNRPVQLPCDHRHLLGHDCLVDVLTSTGPLCPLCRVDILALVSGVAAASQ